PVLALSACLAAGPAFAASTGAGTDTGLPSLNYDPATGEFTEAPPPERGWQAFADLLKKAEPSVNTAIPLTPAQIAEHVAALIDAGRAAEALDITAKQQAARDETATPGPDVQLPYQQGRARAALIDAGRADEALDIIAKQQAARDEIATPGTDVQLRYQQGRALVALGRHDDAMAVWRQMTTDYPELPEPWNALAIEYARRGQLRLARDSLDMALVSDPSFAAALENLGHVQMRLAQASFARARAAGASA